MIRYSWVALFVALAACLLGADTAPTEFIEIDGVINIMTAGTQPVITTQEALDAVAKANEILKKAGIKIVVKKVNSDPASAPVAAGNGDGDASLTDPESDDTFAAGDSELDGVVGAGKGIKITFVVNPEDGNVDNPGLSMHVRGVSTEPTDRTVIVRKRASTQETGETVAHEVAHTLTLGPGHVISTAPAENADGGGHAPDTPDGNTNLMAPSTRGNGRGRTGTALTTQQVENIRDGARHTGRTTTKPAASTPASVPTGGSGGLRDLDHDSHMSLPGMELRGMYAYHCCNETAFDLSWTVNGPVNTPIAVQLKYFWLFDADSNFFTGVPMFGMQGVDTGVEILFFTNGLGFMATQVFQHDYTLATSFPLPPAVVLPLDRLGLSNLGVEKGTLLQISAMYPQLRLTAPAVPMMLVVQDQMSGIPADAMQSQFIPDYESTQPQLSVAPPLASPGSTVAYSGHGFHPPGPATLFLDDTAIDAGVPVQFDGTVAGSFAVPLTPPTVGTFYFVTLMDAQQATGFSILHVAAVCATCLGDISGDNSVDGADIAGWVRCSLAASLPGDLCACSTGMTAAQFINKLLADPNPACP